MESTWVTEEEVTIKPLNRGFFRYIESVCKFPNIKKLYILLLVAAISGCATESKTKDQPVTLKVNDKVLRVGRRVSKP